MACSRIHFNLNLRFPSDAAPIASTCHSPSRLSLSLSHSPLFTTTPKADNTTNSKNSELDIFNFPFISCFIYYFNYFFNIGFVCFSLLCSHLLRWIRFSRMFIYIPSFYSLCCVLLLSFSAQIAYSSAPRRTCGAVCSQMTMEEKPLSENRMLVSFLLLFVLFCLMGFGSEKLKLRERGKNLVFLFSFWLFVCGGFG